MTAKKYTLTAEGSLFRIVAIRDGSWGDVGTVGGLVAGEENLSHEGQCWIEHDAQCIERAVVSDNARLEGFAIARGDALIYEFAVLRDHCVVEGGARVHGVTRILDEARVFDRARVFGRATLRDRAAAYGQSRVSGNAVMSGDSRAKDGCRIYGRASVGESAVVEAGAYIVDNAVVGGSARAGGNAYVGGDADLRGNSRVLDNVRVGGNARLLDHATLRGRAEVDEGVELRAVPLSIQGTRDALVIFGDLSRVQIGRRRGTIEDWLANYDEWLSDAGYTEAETTEYLSHLRHAGELIAYHYVPQPRPQPYEPQIGDMLEIVLQGEVISDGWERGLLTVRTADPANGQDFVLEVRRGADFTVV